MESTPSDKKINISEKTGENSNSNKAPPEKALYLGLLVSEPIEKLHNLIVSSLNQILEHYPGIEDAVDLIKNIEEGVFEDTDVYKNPWKYPKDNKKWHITSLFKKKSFNKSHPAYSSFESDKVVVVNIKTIIYVPKKIITSVIFTDAPIENEFPHMTTLLGSWAAKNSNDICAELFAKGKPLEKEYKKLMKNELNEDSFTQKLEVKIFGKSESVYVIKFQNPVQFDTRMAAFFK